MVLSLKRSIKHNQVIKFSQELNYWTVETPSRTFRNVRREGGEKGTKTAIFFLTEKVKEEVQEKR